MWTFICPQLLCEIQTNVQHSDGKTRSQRIWAFYLCVVSSNFALKYSVKDTETRNLVKL